MADYILPDDAGLFDGSMLGELVDQSVSVKKALNELVNKCWYTDELIVVHMQVPENLELYQEYFLDNLGESFEVVTLFSHVLLSTEEILRRVVHALYPDEEIDGDRDLLLDRLFRHVDELAEESAELLIQVNDAHQLSAEVLRDLAEILADHAIMVTPHILLWSDKSNEQTFQAGFTGSDITVGTLSVPGFSPREVADYMKVVFRKYDMSIPFEKDTLQEIVRESRGIGQEIDRVVTAALTAEDEVEEEYSRSFPLIHMILGIAAVTVLGIVFFMGKEPDASIDRPPVALSVEGAEDDAPVQEVFAEVDSDRASAAAAAEIQESTDEVDPEQVINSDFVIAENSGVRELDIDVAPDRTRAEESVQAASASTEEVSGQELPVDAPVVVAIQQQAEQEPGVVVEDPVAPVVNPEPIAVIEEQAAPAVDPEPVVTEPEPVAPVVTSAYEAQLQELLAHADESAFIQLYGTYEEEAALSFIDEYAIDDMFYYFKTDLNGRDWYVVVYGGFVSERAAINVKDTLTGRLAEGGPWIRGIANIRNTLKP